MFTFLTEAAPAGMGGSTIIMLVVMVAIFYFMLIRPENKKKKAAEEMRSSLKVGDKITTIGGMIGRVVHVSEDKLTFETSEDRVRIEVTKWAVSSKGAQTDQNAAPEASKKEKKAEEKTEE